MKRRWILLGSLALGCAASQTAPPPAPVYQEPKLPAWESEPGAQEPELEDIDGIEWVDEDDAMGGASGKISLRAPRSRGTLALPQKRA